MTEDSSFTFYAISDFGNPTNELKQVASAMHQYAQGNQSPSMILGLGDNFYPYGVSSPEDSAFQEVWSNIFLQVSHIYYYFTSPFNKNENNMCHPLHTINNIYMSPQSWY